MAVKKIKLGTSSGVVRDFDFQHALALLRLEKKQGKISWQIKTEGYQFLDDEIVKIKKKEEPKES